MDNRNNTIAGWVLFAGICALGLTIGSGMLFASHDPHKPGFPIEDTASGEGGAKSAVPLPNLLAAADVEKGKAVFAKCAACHTDNQGGANGIGPNLYAVVGDEIGHGRGGFAFSDVLKNHGGSWTFENLDQWLTSPRKFASGTKMSFAGLSSPEDRANLIVYLNAQGSNVPLPKAEAAPAGDAAAAPAASDKAAAPAAAGADKSATAPAAGATAAPAAPAEAKK